jgi:hypothetical protein
MQLITPIKARYGRSTFDLAERAIDAIYRRCNTTFWFSHGLDPNQPVELLQSRRSTNYVGRRPRRVTRERRTMRTIHH